MTVSTRAALALTLICAALTGCQMPQQTAGWTSPTPSPVKESAGASSQSAALNAFFEERFQTELALSPIRQTMLGIDEMNDRWDLVGDDKDRAYLDVAQASLDGLAQFDLDILSEQDRISAEVFRYSAEQRIARYPWRHHQYVVTQFDGAHTTIPSFLINFHRIETRKDAADYIARLYDAERYLDETVDAVQKRARMGFTAPAFTFAEVVEAAKNVVAGRPFTDGEDAPLYADFKRKLSASAIPETDHAALIEDVEAALTTAIAPAYERFIAFMQDLGSTVTTDHGVWKLDPTGAFYRTLLAYHTTTDLTADEIHALGLAEVARIQDEMRTIMQAVNFDGDLQDFFTFTRTDPQFYYPNTDAGRTAYMTEAAAIIDRMGARLDEIFITKPKAPIVVKRVEPFRERSAGKAFYESPSPDGSRPGAYYANLYDMTQMPIYQMEALAFHEGIPGHHMQIAIAQELEEMPRFRRFGGFTAYIEGWGLYSEYLPKEMGFYADPYSDFGRLAMELWRAARLVVDTGLHHKRWSRQQAVDYLIANTPNPEDDCRKAIDRYLVFPGQATAYKIGMQTILELRDEAERELGDGFDIRAFHDAILRNGAVPLPILEEIVRSNLGVPPSPAT